MANFSGIRYTTVFLTWSLDSVDQVKSFSYDVVHACCVYQELIFQRNMCKLLGCSIALEIVLSNLVILNVNLTQNLLTDFLCKTWVHSYYLSIVAVSTYFFNFPAALPPKLFM